MKGLEKSFLSYSSKTILKQNFLEIVNAIFEIHSQIVAKNLRSRDRLK